MGCIDREQNCIERNSLLELKYLGPELECISVKSGDNLNTALVNIDDIVCNIYDNGQPISIDTINIGIGQKLYTGISTDNKRQFRTILAGEGIEVTSTDREIVIKSTTLPNSPVREINLGVFAGSLVDSEVEQQVNNAINLLPELNIGGGERVYFKVTTKSDYYKNGKLIDVTRSYRWNRGKGDWTTYDVLQSDYSLEFEKPMAPPLTKTSELDNDGEDGLNPFISSADIHDYELTPLVDNKFTFLKDGVVETTIDLNNLLIPGGERSRINRGEFITNSSDLILYRDEDFTSIVINLQALVDMIPKNTSDLANDGSDGTSTYVENDDLGAVAFSDDYVDLMNKPDIPDRTSDLINDGEDGILPFITQSNNYNLSQFNSETKTFDFFENGTLVKTIGPIESGTTTVPTKAEQIEKTTSFTLDNTMDEQVVFIDNGVVNITITVPTGLTNNFKVGFVQIGTGNVTFSNVSGVVVKSFASKTIMGQNYQAFLQKRNSNGEFILLGNLKPL